MQPPELMPQRVNAAMHLQPHTLNNSMTDMAHKAQLELLPLQQRVALLEGQVKSLTAQVHEESLAFTLQKCNRICSCTMSRTPRDVLL